mgnify:CR=1 FL=1
MPEDCQLLFSWRNDPWIVSLSASQQTVSMSEHQAWFSRALVRDDMLIRIISDTHGQDMGLVRVVRENETEATITVYLMQPFIGKKRGPKAIRQACEFAFAQWPEVQSINALIRRENTRSVAAFASVGFKKKFFDDTIMVDGMKNMYLTRENSLIHSRKWKR